MGKPKKHFFFSLTATLKRPNRAQKSSKLPKNNKVRNQKILINESYQSTIVNINENFWPHSNKKKQLKWGKKAQNCRQNTIK